MSEPDSTPPAPQRFRLTIAYDGSGFHGWQKQEPPGADPLRTVCGEMEKALAHVLRQRVALVGASRTDAGVHALGQVAHFDAVCRVPVEKLPTALNSKLPDDIEVCDAAIAKPGFDAIKDAKRKQYRYRLFNSPRKPLTRRRVTWHCWLELDLDRMNDAAARLVGTHDVEGLSAADHGRESTVRTIFHCAVERPPHAEPEVHIVVQGDGFLYNMVRIIAGTLVEVGRGHFPPQQIDRILETRERRLAGPTLPPQGLWLEWIAYE